MEVIDSHRQEDIISVLEAYPADVRAQVEEVSVDLWGGYATVIKTVFPKARIVYNHFHVIQQVNRGVNQLRRRLQVKFQGLPHLLWKNWEQLTEAQKQQLDEGLKPFPHLAMADELKEDPRRIYASPRTVPGATVKMQRWV